MVKENPAWGREKGECLLQATALGMAVAVEATLRNWELAADVVGVGGHHACRMVRVLIGKVRGS